LGIAVTDPFPILDDQHRPLGGFWRLSGTEMIVTRPDSSIHKAPFFGYEFDLRVLARRLGGV
jgi:hypothetical protein